MAKNTKTNESNEIINLGEFINRLGISRPTWEKHPEYRDFLEKQDGVTFEARKSFIPAHLVAVVRDAFDIQPGAKRAPRGSRKQTVVDAGPNYSTMKLDELYDARGLEEELLADGEGQDFDAEIAKLEEALDDARRRHRNYTQAQGRLETIDQAIEVRKQELKLEAQRVADELALAESRGA
ncbi:hypothetical protein CH252_04970 [Rhodococcus sp. 06-1477-1B]|nr:hypothetical protein CH252_04970 [Rhodococcus sp. 06-1477-1B]